MPSFLKLKQIQGINCINFFFNYCFLAFTVLDLILHRVHPIRIFVDSE